MSTAISLIEQVRSRLLDYGNGAATLVSAVLDTSATSISLSDVADVSPRQFLMVDNEMLEVLEVYNGSPASAVVVRGARGSAAATHAAGSVVRIDPVYGQHEYLRFLNQALSASFPHLYKLHDSSEQTIERARIEYDIPATCHRLARIEIETGTEGIFDITRYWNYASDTTVVIENARHIPLGRAIRFIGYTKFDYMILSGGLDTSYPSDANCEEYLVIEACARALRARQAPIARRDSFIGITDSFQQNQPFMSTLSARDFAEQAQKLLMKIRMPRLPEYTPDPGRILARRG